MRNTEKEGLSGLKINKKAKINETLIKHEHIHQRKHKYSMLGQQGGCRGFLQHPPIE